MQVTDKRRITKNKRITFTCINNLRQVGRNNHFQDRKIQHEMGNKVSIDNHQNY